MLFLDTSVRNAQAEVIRAAAASGFLVIKSGTGQTLVSIHLPAAVFDPAAAGAISLSEAVWGTAVLAGRASYFELYRANMTLILRGTVGDQAGDVVLSSVNIQLGDIVSIDLFTYVVPEA